MRRSRDFAPYQSGSSKAAASSRNLFVRAGDCDYPNTLSSPTTTFHSDSASENGSRSDYGDDEVLLDMIQKALRQVRAVTDHTLPRGGNWKERVNSSDHIVLDRRTMGEYSVLARVHLNSSLKELQTMLSSENTDAYNATMVALFGDSYSFGLNLRTIPTNLPNTHLTLKISEFAGPIPLVSSKHAAEYLDYVEYHAKDQTMYRSIQSVKRNNNGTNGDESPQYTRGNTVAGYVLREDSQTSRTTLFFYGCYASRSGGPISTGPLGEPSVQKLLKAAMALPKLGDITFRRRLGRHQLMDPSEILQPTLSSASSSCMKCTSNFNALTRKKQLCQMCGHAVCNSCSSTQEREERIGIIDKIKICKDCFTKVTIYASL